MSENLYTRTLQALGEKQLAEVLDELEAARRAGVPCSVEVEIQVCGKAPPVVYIGQRTKPRRVAG